MYNIILINYSKLSIEKIMRNEINNKITYTTLKNANANAKKIVNNLKILKQITKIVI